MNWKIISEIMLINEFYQQIIADYVIEKFYYADNFKLLFYSYLLQLRVLLVQYIISKLYDNAKKLLAVVEGIYCSMIQLEFAILKSNLVLLLKTVKSKFSHVLVGLSYL